MFSIISITSLTLSAIAAVNGLAVPRAAHARAALAARSGYDQPVLEPYDVYHTRYEALDCEDQHSSTFFTDCCHPMKIGETLEKDRKPYCNPNNGSSSASAPVATPTDDGDDGDCDDGGDESSSASSSAASTPTPPPAAPASAKPSPVVSSVAASSSAAPAPVNVAPEPPKDTPTSSAKPSPSPTPAPKPSSSPAPAPAPSPPSRQFSGDGTWFVQNGVAGACGAVHSDNDFIVAIDTALYGNTGEKSQYCGKSLTITNKATGKQAHAIVADACPTCDGKYALDMSKGLFEDLTGDLGIGLFAMEWHFN